MANRPTYSNPIDFLREVAGVDLGQFVDVSADQSPADTRQPLQATKAAVSTTDGVPGVTAGLRHVTDDHGMTWFALWDLCQMLGLKNSHVASKRLRPDQLATYRLTEAGERGPAASVMVSEPGMWKLILTSRTPLGRRVEALVTNEVLPAIRKKGAYLTDKLSDEIAAVLLTQDRCTDQALVALDQGRPAEVAARLRQSREAQGKLNELIDREPLPITRGVADPVRSPELRKALGLGKHRPQDVVAGYADDVVNEPREYRYPAQYAR